jgi:replication-associated recombination protein RarA
MKCEIKYAPASLGDVIFADQATKDKIQLYAQGALSGNIMLWGSNGASKSTVAQILVQTLGGTGAQYCSSYEEVLGQKDIKQYLQNACSFARMTESKRFYLILDEFDNAKGSLDKFWRALDSCGDEVMAIITTNEPMQVHRSVRSRFDLIEMKGLTGASVLARAQTILQAEGVNLPDPQVLAYLMTLDHMKDIRKYMRLLDNIIALSLHGMALPAWVPPVPPAPPAPTKPVMKVVTGNV